MAVTRIMQLLAPSARITISDRFSSNTPKSKGIPIRELFTEGRAMGTVLLWIPYFMNLLIIYFVVSWLPSILRQEGMSITAGVAAIMSFSVGGAIGCLITGHLLRKLGPARVVLAEFCATVCMITALALSPTSLWTMLIITRRAWIRRAGGPSRFECPGCRVLSHLLSVRPVSAGLSALCRIGSIVGPLLGGLMLSLDWSPAVHPPERGRPGAIRRHRDRCRYRY